MRLVDIPTAAHAVHVRRTVIRVWIRRGHLVLHDGMLDLGEVYRCEVEHRDDRRGARPPWADLLAALDQSVGPRGS